MHGHCFLQPPRPKAVCLCCVAGRSIASCNLPASPAQSLMFVFGRDLVIENRRVSEESMVEEVKSGKRNIMTFRRDMDHFRRQLQDIRRIQPKQ